MPKQQTSTGLFDETTFSYDTILNAALASEISYGRTDLTSALNAGGFTNVTGSLGLSATKTSTGYYVDGNASAIVLEKDGVIYVAFAGTSVENPLPDVVEYWNLNGQAMIDEYYADLSAVMDAVMTTYGSDTQIVATGHSLGGSAVDGALDAYDAADNLQGITFNSPTSGLVDDPRELNFGFENDLINEIVGDRDAGNAVQNLYYAVLPGEPMPDAGGETWMSFLSKALQAWTSPAHDIARFPDAIEALRDSQADDAVSRNDVVVVDGSRYTVSLDAMAHLSPSFDKAMATSTRVGLIGQDGADTLIGSRYRDAIDGGTGADVINGLGGDDLIWTGDGMGDRVVFTAGFGRDTVMDYVDGDILSFQNGVRGGSNIASIDALRQWDDLTRAVSVKESGADLVVSFKGTSDSVTLKDVLSTDDGMGVV